MATYEKIIRGVDLYDAFAIGRRIFAGVSDQSEENIGGWRTGYVSDAQLLANFEAGLRGDASAPHED